jgi:hypothetical protein
MVVEEVMMRDDFRFAWQILTRFKLYAVAAVTTLALARPKPVFAFVISD